MVRARDLRLRDYSTDFRDFRDWIVRLPVLDLGSPPVCVSARLFDIPFFDVTRGMTGSLSAGSGRSSSCAALLGADKLSDKGGQEAPLGLVVRRLHIQLT